ncbi:MAG: hypothetical protein ING73_06830 [Rhodocyclaceae bacterium]|nr:hypothetical protein [Rhodocyclaceae bacterium]MCA3025229.1 hypothetical protein [Rhodocyclaceae bacterium]MCA3032165.1 hypothetical protein [Rhodocyclaceae bacterium]MCA3038960.1 hypothetical protein [Rhodocyclaceae bacterium]MCA3045500.1 hypothetical protein [Rhodocyclaceae bacterium]
MPISIEQRLTLYRLSRDHWLEAHATLSAYEREYRTNKSVCVWMRRGTLVSAVLTALSTATPWPPLTVVSGVLTAALSAIEQAYAPARSSQAFWDCRTQLEGIKKDLVVCVIAIESAADMASGMGPINQIATRLTEGTKVPFDVLASDREAAKHAFRDSVLAGIIGRHEQEPNQDEDKPAALGVDAPDVVAVARQPLRLGRG